MGSRKIWQGRTNRQNTGQWDCRLRISSAHYQRTRQFLKAEGFQKELRWQVQFMWVPAHVGVKGNEQVDELAKRALKKGNIEMQIKISKAEVKSFIWEKN